MIRTKYELNRILKLDLERYNGKAPNLVDRMLRREHLYIWRYIVHMRHLEYYGSMSGLYKLAYMWHFVWFKRLQFKLRIAIYPNTVAEGFKLYHLGAYTHIGPNVHIGKNCTIVSGVVFGNKSEDEDNRPVIVGDNVYFGIGCKIIGPVRIGSNVCIGANAVITRDIPDNAIVGGIPARIIKYKE